MWHSDSTVTLEVYSHFIPDTQEKVVFALNNISKNDYIFSTGICRFPPAGVPRQEYGFAVLTNRGRIHERLQKNDGCKTAFVIFGTPDGNRTHN